MTIRKLSKLDTNGNFKNHKSSKDAKILPLVFTFSSFGDTNGLFYYLGKKPTGIWNNPYTSNQIRIIFETIGNGYLEMIVNRNESVVHSINSSNQFVMFDIGENKKINLSNITIQHSNQHNGFYLRNFKIRGSNNLIYRSNYAIDSVTWTDIAIFTNNTLINSISGWGNFVIPQNQPYNKYRWIQIINLDSGILMFGEIEFYGKLFLD